MRPETVPLSAFLLPVLSAGITPLLYVRWCSQLAKASSVKTMHQLHRRESINPETGERLTKLRLGGGLS
ncbi:hypothetical protein HHUSO_G22681 [Huso huso]|uniref:Uncharacterized protein n=1 Tax=Huso huso TaxID=61971 RepID=A0ABR0YUN5_HUSHU